MRLQGRLQLHPRVHRQERTLAFAGLIASLAFAAPALADPQATTHVLELGTVRVEVVDGSATSEKAGDARDGYIAKAGAGRRDEIALKGGSALARDIAPILSEGLTKECAKKVDGSFAYLGGDGGELARMSFAWAVVTEIGMPALDVAGGTADITLKLEPQFARRVFQKGPVTKPPAGPGWKRSGFKLGIDGLNTANTKQVSELKITQAPIAGTPVTCAAPVVSDLTFTVPDADAGALAGWKDARGGAIDYLAADGSMLVKVKLTGLKKKSQSSAGGLTKVVASVDAVTLAKK